MSAMIFASLINIFTKFQSSFSNLGITKLPRIISSGLDIFFLALEIVAAGLLVGFEALFGLALGSDPMASKSFRSSVRKAVPRGLVSLFRSDLNCEYCDSRSLLICYVCCLFK